MGETKFRIEPMPVGAEVVDLEEGAASDPETARALYAAWLEHGMLLFRNVTSIEKHLALSGIFGEPEIHPLPQFRDPEEPLLMPLGDDSGPAYVYDGTDLRRGRLPWHRDTGYMQAIAKGGMLRIRAVPEAHGETLFVDTARAYDELPSDVKEQIDDLEFRVTFSLAWNAVSFPGALWKTSRLATTEEYPANERMAAASGLVAANRFPSAVHRVVTRHPESGLKCLFLSPKDFDGFLGMSRGESDELCEYLVGHMIQDHLVYKHAWTVDDALVWDNRRLIHAAMGYRVDHHRHGQRTTLSGAFNAGRLFDPATDSAPEAAWRVALAA